MAYADYEFYKGVYCGFAVKEEEFPYYAERAADYINGKLCFMEVNDNTKKACCALAEVYSKHDKGGGIAAEKVGDYSVNFVAGISNTLSLEEQLAAVLKTYFKTVGWV